MARVGREPSPRFAYLTFSGTTRLIGESSRKAANHLIVVSERSHLSGFVYDGHKVSRRLEKLGQPKQTAIAA